MGFDKNDPNPIPVTTEKKTTKVNIGVIIGVVIFFILGAFGVRWIWKHPTENAVNVQQKIDQKDQKTDQKSP